MFRIQYLKEILLLPALLNRDEKVIGGLAGLLSEIGQAVSILLSHGMLNIRAKQFFLALVIVRIKSTKFHYGIQVIIIKYLVSIYAFKSWY